MGGFSLQDLAQTWRTMTAVQRFILVGLVTAGLGVVGLLVTYYHTPEYKPLYVHLESRDAAAVTQKLKEIKIPYRLSDEGSTILVPAANLYQTRLEMASAGVLTKGTVGFDLFDKVRLQTSALSEKVTYQRALQGELQATIGSIEEVESVRVLLSLPRQEIFLDDQRETTASVMLKLRTGRRLAPTQVKAIRALVAASVENVKAEHIVVMDTQGNLFTHGDDETQATGAANTLLELQRTRERDLESRVTAMLDPIVGQAVVRVNVELETTQKTVQADQFVQADKDTKQPIMRSVQSTSEEYTGATPGASASGAPAPAPSAVPSGLPAAIRQAIKEPAYKHTVTTQNYEPSRVQTKEVVTPGSIKRISVAVAVSSKALKSKEALDELTALVERAAGIDKNRKDEVKVSAMDFRVADTTEATKAMEKEERQKMYLQYARVGAPVLAVLLFWFIGARVLRRAATLPARPHRVNVRLQPQDAAALPPGTGEDESLLPTGSSPAFAPRAEEPSPLGLGVGDGDASSFAWDPRVLDARSVPGGSASADDTASTVRNAALARPNATLSILEQWVTKQE